MWREAVISKGVFVLLGFQSFSHIGFSHQRLDADDEVLDCEWFFKVVVGSQFEASDNIVRDGFGREEERGGMVVGLPDAADAGRSRPHLEDRRLHGETPRGRGYGEVQAIWIHKHD